MPCPLLHVSACPERFIEGDDTTACRDVSVIISLVGIAPKTTIWKSTSFDLRTPDVVQMFARKLRVHCQ
jgi:hypothetical protein